MPVKPQKGSFAYIKQYKKYKGMISILWIILILAAYISGILIFGTNKNYVTLIAVLMVLPGAKAWVASIVMMPYHSVSKEIYDQVCDLMKDKQARVYADVVVTKYEGAMALSVVVIYNDNYYALMPKQKKGLRDVQAYLTSMLEAAGLSTKAQIYDNEEKYFAAVRQLSQGPDLESKKMKTLEQNLLSAAL